MVNSFVLVNAVALGSNTNITEYEESPNCTNTSGFLELGVFSKLAYCVVAIVGLTFSTLVGVFGDGTE